MPQVRYTIDGLPYYDATDQQQVPYFPQATGDMLPAPGVPGQMPEWFNQGVRSAAAGLAQPFLAPGRAMQGGYAVQPTTPGLWSEEDEFRRQHAQGRMVEQAADLGMGMVGAPGGVGGVGSGVRFSRLKGAVESDPSYVYHATNQERALDIANAGKLKRYKPHQFTDQDVWPDGSVERRNYFTPTAQNTWQFAPEEGHGVLLRVKRDAHPFKREITGDLYSVNDVPLNKIEALTDDGWKPLSKDFTLGATER